jgi:hypothetical protein
MVSPKTHHDPASNVSDQDCTYFLERSERLVDQTRRSGKWVALVGAVIALLAVTLNLDILEITKFKIGDAELIVRDLTFLRTFLTLASLGSVLAIAYFVYLRDHQMSITNYLSKTYNHSRSNLHLDFSAWCASRREFVLLRLTRAILFSLIFILLAVLPLGTFVFSLVRK